MTTHTAAIPATRKHISIAHCPRLLEPQGRQHTETSAARDRNTVLDADHLAAHLALVPDLIAASLDRTLKRLLDGVAGVLLGVGVDGTVFAVATCLRSEAGFQCGWPSTSVHGA